MTNPEPYGTLVPDPPRAALSIQSSGAFLASTPRPSTAGFVKSSSWTDPDRASIARSLARRVRAVRATDALATAAVLVALHVGGLARSARDTASAIAGAVGLPQAIPGVPSPLMSYTSLSVGIQTASLFLGLALAGAAVSMPFSYIGGFRLARSVGLGTQSTGAWARDYTVASVLGAGLVAILSGLVGWASADAPHLWWVAASLLGTLGTVVVTHLAPVLILPLFYKITPLADGPVRTRLLDLTTQAGTTVRGCDVIDQSRRSRTANAGIIGLGRTRRIMVTDTLLDGGYSTAEIAAIFAHELGHHVHGDMAWAIAVDGILMAGCLAMTEALRAWLAPPLGLGDASDLAGVPAMLLIFGVISTTSMPLRAGVSRWRESRADAYGVRLTRDPESWVRTLERLGWQNLAEVDPPRWIEWATYTHPAIARRIASARSTDLAITSPPTHP